MLKKLNEKNFDEEMKQGLKLAAFTAHWCGYCQMQMPILEEISDKVNIGIVDGDESPALTAKYRISSFPSYLLFNNGKIIGQFSGYMPKFDFMNRLLGYLK